MVQLFTGRINEAGGQPPTKRQPDLADNIDSGVPSRSSQAQPLNGAVFTVVSAGRACGFEPAAAARAHLPPLRRPTSVTDGRATVTVAR